MRILDITPLVSPRIGVWPGDVPYRRDLTCAIADGANIDLSSITTTVHLGAHTDAPSHYAREGKGISERPLDRYLGPCQVVSVPIGRGERIRPEHVAVPITAPRVLLRTGTFPDPERWNSDFASLSPELVHFLADRGVVLVGIDTPSIDLQDDKALLSHTAVAARDLAVLEGIVLDGVPDGAYTLIALPLKLEGADASPVRAVLVVE
jgi:arylformamidase